MREVLQDIQGEIRGAWRFRWVAMILAWLVCVVGWFVVFLMPDQYRAEARFYVSAETPLREAMSKMINTSSELSAIAFVRAEMLSRPVLEQVARETDLDLRATTPREKESLIENLRRTVKIDSVSQGRGRRGGDSGFYLVSYQDHERSKAVAVVDSVLETFKTKITVGSVDDRNSSIGFLEQQVDEYERQLKERERALAIFKRENAGLLPGEGGGYFDRLQREKEALELLQGQLQVALGQRGALERQYRGEGNSAPRANTVELRDQISELERRLSELLLLYTDQHPDVIAVRSQSDQLKQRLADESAQDTDAGVDCRSLSDNVVCQDIQIRLNEINVAIAALEGQIGGKRADVERLEKMVDQIPDVEARYIDLQRDYGQVKRVYEDLRQKLEVARIGAGVTAWSGANFSILDPPLAGRDPVAPNRPVLLIVVLLGALGAGAASAYLLHMLRPVFSDARSLMEATGLPVLGAVSMTWVSRHRKQRLVEASSLAVVALTLVIALVLVLMFQDAGVDAAAKVKRLALS